MSLSEPLQPGGFVPIEAKLTISDARSPVVLSQGSAKLYFPSETLTGNGEMLLRFLPEPRFCIETKFQRAQDNNFEYVFVAGALESTMEFVFEGQRIDGFATRRQVVRPASILNSSVSSIELDWSPGAMPLYFGDIDSRSVTSVILHLFNFPNFRGNQSVHFGASSFGALLILESRESRVWIQGLPRGATGSAWRRIKAEGGCHLTHVAKLERKDCAALTLAEFELQREMLASFLSFVKGRNYSLAYNVALCTDGVTAWRSFDHPTSDHEVNTWFSTEDGSQAEMLFPLFEKRWNLSPNWRDCLSTAIYWYTQATTEGRMPSIGAAIILTQSALERLAHHHAVIDQKVLSAEQFNALRASDRIRMLLSSLKIPIEITEDLPEIKRFNELNSGSKFTDGPHAFTYIRNSLVHPVAKQEMEDCYIDAWRLGLWYLELAILALCEYSGKYENRMIGEMSFVPWYKKQKAGITS
ncbi:hypothetical protein [Alkalisalibacterium limincola]|uniref:YopA central domain-containing protein n=1 Tax=Alkalisalibacterium limincola TaxID=2699169 RepID=A0A5C8KZR1_9GAMM|nr:hypothetical protein [Alkalisalibacterium limincola]TXK65107.1 hypothetical protein FU658_04855 [Alkalisalibacterium limincola]